MAYVVSATWTAEPGKEDVVLDAIEKLTPPSREEAGNRILPGLPGPRRARRLPPLRDLRRRGGVRRPRCVGPLQGVRARAGHPRAGQPRARVLPDDRLTHDAHRRLPPVSDEPDVPTGRARGRGRRLLVHPRVPRGHRPVELLAAEADEREEAADVAAQSDGLRPEPGRAAAAGVPGGDARLPHLRGPRRGHGARARQPRPARGAVRRAGLPVHGPARGHRSVRRRRDPPDTERLDFELEIAAIVVRDVRNATPEEARDAIGGYFVMNDWSARDVQGKEMKLKLGPPRARTSPPRSGPGW